MGQQDKLNILVIWRGKHLKVEVDRTSKVHELGDKLRKLTDVKSDTLKLLVPQSRSKSSRLIYPFSDEHSHWSLTEASIIEGKAIRMMGAFDNEVKEVSETSIKSDLRIVGFDEEEKRLRHRSLHNAQASLKLPQGAYIFCSFRTLHLPGIELNPPPSEALRRMHMLASDRGIIAIMNKHHWRVGIMTEMAPVGYVGISPKCILGFNKNQGEEISLRLRTDDLNGFRKYQSIKKTLLHELAHMVHSEHDANFFALNKQLNEEAATLDWTKSRSHTLTGRKISDHYEQELDLGVSSSSSGQKLGGTFNSLGSARASSVAAAYSRFLNAPSEELHASDSLSDATLEPDPDDSELKGVVEKTTAESNPDDTLMIENYEEPDLDDSSLDIDNQMMVESDLFNSMRFIDGCGMRVIKTAKVADPDSDESDFTVICSDPRNVPEPDPDDCISDQKMTGDKVVESNPDDSSEVVSNYSDSASNAMMRKTEPDPEDSSEVVTSSNNSESSGATEAEPGNEFMEPDPGSGSEIVLNSNNSALDGVMKVEPDPDDDLQVIEEPGAAICSRIQRAIDRLRSEATSLDATSALQLLIKIIRNVIEHPEEMKFRKLRKSNPQIQKNVVNYKAAMEIITIVGFCEDFVLDEVGRGETYLVLKRNDPGLLWLVMSCLEVSMA
ncbi:uncharacterized protein A4U43_C05F21130 [Asparagus officinalis]|uniref:WLM domain-containing protein n=1 Tax=Asparagus officinalis TaxID=4686 RepID=A0A5P1EUL3_ASPOF|nr:uncharacterized protein LOC109840125 [Asparagus officinalis]XP_020264232.1 uncharacterized protein LOC109840125 [Asparagus officinalis]XP_020264233.1 uncharacterized protein LOC109840125 [Asparagus officinalis]XP_020264234.1 uncharacterized protein LOC109840125 [Asparagus officinalis]ONK69273.1 uncharacterized protein A4U43_C05F21130 [Asparagus officinalis]